MSHKKAGIMSLVLTGRNQGVLQGEALAIRDELARRMSYAANLVQEAVDDPNIPVDSYAQHIVDDELAKHPDVVILAIHATTPRNSDPETLASNIGRIGKKADDDDMRVVREGKTNLEVNKDLMRYEVELPLNDAAGERIGALGVVVPLTTHTDQKARHAEAIRIRDEIGRPRNWSNPTPLPHPRTRYHCCIAPIYRAMTVTSITFSPIRARTSCSLPPRITVRWKSSTWRLVSI